MNRALLISSSLLFAACGGPLVTADFEAPEICHELDAVSFPGSPLDTKGTLAFEIPFQLPVELRSREFDTETHVELLSITAIGEGVKDLGFIESAVVSAKVEGEPVVLAQYEEGQTMPDDRIRLVPSQPVDIVELTGAEAVPLQTSVTGVMPATPWNLRYRVCHRVQMRSTYTP